MEFFSKSEEQTREIAQKITKKLLQMSGDMSIFVGLIGELGAGKTTFMKGVAELLDINTPIQSPTFVIQKKYSIDKSNQKKLNHSFKNLIHMDLYRLNKEEELKTVRWDEYLNNPENILFVEWPNQIWQDYPEGMVEIDIKHDLDGGRTIILKNEK